MEGHAEDVETQPFGEQYRISLVCSPAANSGTRRRSSAQEIVALQQARTACRHKPEQLVTGARAAMSIPMAKVINVRQEQRHRCVQPLCAIGLAKGHGETCRAIVDAGEPVELRVNGRCFG
jgi:hypothetical protein